MAFTDGDNFCASWSDQACVDAASIVDVVFFTYVWHLKAVYKYLLFIYFYRERTDSPLLVILEYLDSCITFCHFVDFLLQVNAEQSFFMDTAKA